MLNTYKAIYNSKQIEVKAKTTYEAQCKANETFKAKKQYQITVYLLKLGTEEVVHNTCVL